MSRTNFKDPLAQTFIIDPEENPQGVFLHSIDVCFTSRDSGLPITLRIHPTNEGYPNKSVVVPFSESHLFPDDVRVTQRPRIGDFSKFKFETPVFLQPGEYAFTLNTNSVNYEVFSAVVGEEVINPNTGRRTLSTMNRAPYSGVMFKSQNGSSWKPSVEETLMFRLNRVNFITGTTFGVRTDLQFDKDQIARISPFKEEGETFEYDESGSNSRFTYDLFKVNSTEVRDFDNTTPPSYRTRHYKFIKGQSPQQTQFRDTPINENIQYDETMIFLENQANSFSIEIRLATDDNKVSPFVDLQDLNVLFVQSIINNLDIRDNDFTIINGGSGYAVDDLFDIVQEGEKIGEMKVNAEDGGAVTELEVINQTRPATLRPELVNQSGTTGTGLEVIFSSELDPFSGLADAKYISKRFTLKSGFESQDMKVLVNATRPPGTGIHVYYKIKSPDDPQPFVQKPWNRMYELTNINQTSTDINDILPLEFVTYKTNRDGTVEPATKGGTFYRDESGVVYEEFNDYAIKIVLTSENEHIVPIVDNFGAIALITPIEPKDIE